MARSRAPKSPISPSTTPESSAPSDPVPDPLRDFIAFFERELGEVCFPKHEGAELSAAKLNELAERLREHTKLEAQADAALVKARNELAASHRALQSAAKQAHAYARVFLSDRPELLEGLNAMRLNDRKLAPRKTRKTAKKRVADTAEKSSQLKLAQDEPSAA